MNRLPGVTKQHGLTLIELMVSLVLSGLILAGTVSLFQQSRNSSIQDEQIARMQENGRFALRILAREVSMHGYFGGKLDPDNADKSDAETDLGDDCAAVGALEDWVVSLDDPVRIANDVDPGDTDGPDNDINIDMSGCISYANEVSDGTDMLMIKRVADNVALRYRGDGSAATGALEAATMYYKTNRNQGVLYFNNSGTADTTGTSVNTRFDFFAYMPQVFYVRPWSLCLANGDCDCANDGTHDETDCDGDGNADAADTIPVLVRETLLGNNMTAQALVEGIENLQIEFGIDTDDDTIPNYYEPNPDATELASAVSARIYVLVRSIDPITGYTNDKTYRLGSEEVPPANDGFYRRVYATTVIIRNAGPFMNSEI